MINKLDLVSIISKYYLNGMNESVKWEIKDNNLTIKFTAPDKSMIGKVTYEGFELEDSTVGISNTTQLNKLLAITNGYLSLEYFKQHKLITKLIVADNLELAEEQMWELWFAYQGEQWMGEVDYPGSFNIRDTGKEIEQLQIAANTNPADPRVKAAIDMKILDWLDLDEDELAALADPRIISLDTVPEENAEFMPHVMINPITGEQRTVTSQEEHIVLANQGWIHEEE